MKDTIDYGALMHDAMRSLIQKILGDIQTTGSLPGHHHFFITYDTQHPDVDMADWLREQYPSEITVVIQNWFDGLEVDDEGFAITLNFGDSPEPLYIPYMAIQTFMDPSVEFGLRFDAPPSDEGEEEPQLDLVYADDDDDDDDPAPTTAEVVSLDAFRKS